MKTIKNIIYALCAVIILLCAAVTACALVPDLSDQLADMLYGEDRQPYYVHEDTPTPAPAPIDDEEELGDGDGGMLGEIADALDNLAEAVPTIAPLAPAPTFRPEITRIDVSSLVPANQVTTYVAPLSENLTIPGDVSGRTGYKPLEESTKQLSDEEIEKLKEELQQGSLGQNLSFDAVYYPYYYMLDSTEQVMYRQIYANALAAQASFQPGVSITTAQMKDAFEAVIYDHPELFWMETAYNCMYDGRGSCVEMILSFNKTAENLTEARKEFSQKTAEILNAARNLADNYAKERYVHDALVSRVQYDASADMNQSAYGALVNGKAVCAGYSRAYQYLMQQLQIPCYYCAGYSGQNHAWNIVLLYNEYYNVDATWDDMDPVSYAFFNRTDADYAANHIRRGMSVNLPACTGETYRGLEENVTDRTDESRSSFVKVAGASEELNDYYEQCYDRIVSIGIGTREYTDVITADLWTQMEAAYNNGVISDAYLTRAINAAGGTACSMQIEGELQENGTYLVRHTISLW